MNSGEHAQPRHLVEGNARECPRHGDDLEPPRVRGHEAQTAVDGIRQRTGALPARGGRPGAGPDYQKFADDFTFMAITLQIL